MKSRSMLTFLAPAFLLLVGLACTGQMSADSLRIAALPQYVCPSATPRATDTPLPTSPPTYGSYFTANLSNYQVGDNVNSVTVQWYAQSAGQIYLSYAGNLATAPFYWAGATQVSVGYSYWNQSAAYGAYTLNLPAEVTQATLQVWAATSGYRYTFTIYRIEGQITLFYPPPTWGAPPPVYPTPRPTYTPYPSPTPYVRTNDYFLNDPVYTAPGEPSLQIRFRVTEMQTRPFQGTPTPDPPKTPVPGQLPTTAYPESLYVWTFVIRNFSPRQTYTLYPPAQSFISTILLPNGAEQNVLLFPTYTAAQLAGFTTFNGYSAHNLAPGQQITVRLAAKGPQGTLYRVTWAMDASGRPTPTDHRQPTPLIAGNNLVSWINAVNTTCVGEIAEPR